jgi:phage shock protein E
LIKKHDPEMVLLDIRTPEEFAEGHIAGATNLDFYRADFKDKIAALDPSKTYLIYCRSGNRTRQTAAIAHKAGIKSIVLEQGIIDWSYNKLPLEK